MKENKNMMTPRMISSEEVNSSTHPVPGVLFNTPNIYTAYDYGSAIAAPDSISEIGNIMLNISTDIIDDTVAKNEYLEKNNAASDATRDYCKDIVHQTISLLYGTIYDQHSVAIKSIVNSLKAYVNSMFNNNLGDINTGCYDFLSRTNLEFRSFASHNYDWQMNIIDAGLDFNSMMAIIHNFGKDVYNDIYSAIVNYISSNRYSSDEELAADYAKIDEFNRAFRIAMGNMVYEATVFVYNVESLIMNHAYDWNSIFGCKRHLDPNNNNNFTDDEMV